MQPPTPETPFWRDDAGRRTTVLAILAGREPCERERMLDLHVQAVDKLLRAATGASLEGRDGDVRALVSHASRLCGELAGLWPAGSDLPLA